VNVRDILNRAVLVKDQDVTTITASLLRAYVPWFDYPDDIGKNELHARFWQAVMKDGVVDFIKPDDCTIRKFIKPMRMQKVSSVGLDEEGLLEL
jgi:hypothetical protein